MEWLEIPWRDGASEADTDDGDAPPPEAARQLARIRELMEGTSTYRTLSGVSALIAGAAGLAACAASAWLLAPAGFAAVRAVAPPDAAAVRGLAVAWGLAFVVAFTAELVLTKRAARRAGGTTFYFPEGSPLLRRMRLAYGAPLVVGAAMTATLVRAGAWSAVPAAWLLSYGAALVCAGLFSIGAVRVLGMTNLAIGALAALAPELNLLWLAAGFGAAHVVYGAAILRRGA